MASLSKYVVGPCSEAQLRDLSPPVVRELLPVIDQIEPVLLEVVNGAAEFIPAPEETKRLMRQYYAVKRNLLVRFRDDGIDETPQLAATLTESSAISETLDLAVRSLAGDHVPVSYTHLTLPTILLV